ncbi:unnamed protein product, partial [Prorocentrum cordatum]
RLCGRPLGPRWPPPQRRATWSAGPGGSSAWTGRSRASSAPTPRAPRRAPTARAPPRGCGWAARRTQRACGAASCRTAPRGSPCPGSTSRWCAPPRRPGPLRAPEPQPGRHLPQRRA